MADPSDMLHKPRKIAETLFSLLVWALCQSWCLKNLPKCIPICLWAQHDSCGSPTRASLPAAVITLHLACFLSLTCQEKLTWRSPHCYMVFGKEQYFACAQCFPGGFLPQTFLCSRASWWQSQVEEGCETVLSKIWMASISLLLRCTDLERLECFPPWAPCWYWGINSGGRSGRNSLPYCAAWV